MVEIGQVWLANRLDGGQVMVLILDLQEKTRCALCALVSKNTTPNNSYIELDGGYKVYPSIQGTLSLDSMDTTKQSRIVSVESTKIETIRRWIAMTVDEKISESRSEASRVHLGDATKKYSKTFDLELRAFLKLSASAYSSLSLGVQWHEDLVFERIKSREMNFENFTQASLSSLFATSKLARTIRNLDGRSGNDFARYAIRTALSLRNGNLPEKQKGDKQEYLSRIFNFMENYDLQNMTLRLPNNENVTEPTIQRGPFTLNLIPLLKEALD